MHVLRLWSLDFQSQFDISLRPVAEVLATLPHVTYLMTPSALLLLVNVILPVYVQILLTVICPNRWQTPAITYMYIVKYINYNLYFVLH